MRSTRPSDPIKSIERVKDIQDYLKASNKRNYILFVIGITTGYRAGDLAALKVRDIKEFLRRKEFTIMEQKKEHTKNIKKKNKKPRTVEMVPKIEKLLREYIKDMKDYEFLFQSRKGVNKPLNVESISRILKEAAWNVGIRDIKITSHSMRKTYAYRIFIASGKNIVAVKELLGHSSIEETKLYIGLRNDEYREYNKTLNDLVLL